MSISANGFNPSSIGGMKGFDTESLGGSDLLSQLENRVAQTLNQEDNLAGAAAQQGMQAVNPQEIISYIAEIASSPIAGTNISNLV